VHLDLRFIIPKQPPRQNRPEYEKWCVVTAGAGSSGTKKYATEIEKGVKCGWRKKKGYMGKSIILSATEGCHAFYANDSIAGERARTTTCCEHKPDEESAR
jgi:hypothetical protein